MRNLLTVLLALAWPSIQIIVIHIIINIFIAIITAMIILLAIIMIIVIIIIVIIIIFIIITLPNPSMVPPVMTILSSIVTAQA